MMTVKVYSLDGVVWLKNTTYTDALRTLDLRPCALCAGLIRSDNALSCLYSLIHGHVSVKTWQSTPRGRKLVNLQG